MFRYCTSNFILFVTLAFFTSSVLSVPKPQFWKFNHAVLQLSEGGCQCINYDCGCCEHLDIPRLHLNDTGCVNLTYLADQYGISFTVSVDDKVIFNETVSAKNPPPICFGVPYLAEYAELCIRFYDLEVSHSEADGCVKLEARVEHVSVAEYELGCFHIPLLQRQRIPWTKIMNRL